MFAEAKLISKGAEAYLYKLKWYNKPAIKKVRVRKAYRNPDLDQKLRLTRTKREAKLLNDVKKWGIPAPAIYSYYPTKYTIIMEYLEGNILRDTLLKKLIDNSTIIEVFNKLGRYIARLHENGAIHGDLTTSNIIHLTGSEIALIDFGLGEYTTSIEDFGVEIRVFYNSLKSVHYSNYEELFNTFKHSYKNETLIGEKVMKKFKEISRRGRYVIERRLRKFQ